MTFQYTQCSLFLVQKYSFPFLSEILYNASMKKHILINIKNKILIRKLKMIFQSVAHCRTSSPTFNNNDNNLPLLG